MKFEEKIAKQMHEWYLEATQRLHPQSFNPNAQKKYEELTDEEFIEKAEQVREEIKRFLRL